MLSFFLLSLASLVIAHPSANAVKVQLDNTVITSNPLPQQATLTFHAAPVEYNMTIPLDGTKVYPNDFDKSLNVNIIAMPNFLKGRCSFDTPFFHALVYDYDVERDLQAVSVGPPQPIIAVACTSSSDGSSAPSSQAQPPVAPVQPAMTDNEGQVDDCIPAWGTAFTGKVGYERQNGGCCADTLPVCLPRCYMNSLKSMRR